MATRATAHRNLNSIKHPEKHDPWTWYAGSRVSGNRRTAQSLTLRGCTFKHPSGKKAELTWAGGKRSVYAWTSADSITPGVPTELPPDAVRVRLNPTRGDRHFHVAGRRIDSARVVYLLGDGTAWAVSE
jgi:hypothetical protein